MMFLKYGRRDSVVGIATHYELDDREARVRVPVRSRILLFSTSSIPVLGPTQPHIRWVPAVFSPGINRQGLEADHSSPSMPRSSTGILRRKYRVSTFHKTRTI
jgi:hypothetical protein